MEIASSGERWHMFSYLRLKAKRKELREKLDHAEEEGVAFPVERRYDNLIRDGKLAGGEAELDRRIIALDYRIEKVKKLPLENSSKFIEEISQWKKSQKFFWFKDLTIEETKELEKALTYKNFINLLNGNETIKLKFLNWVIRDHLPAEIFIEYPHLSEILEEHDLTGRIGTIGGSKLKIQCKKNFKCVTLPFEGRDVNILDRSKMIHLRGDWNLTIDEVFKMFQKKNQTFVNVEYFAQGVTNWNAQHMGYWVPNSKTYKMIHMDQIEWWRQLPPMEILTLEEAQSRYGEFMNGKNWAVIVRSARANLNLDFTECHAFLEVAIPSADGIYEIYDFGKYATYFPNGALDTMTTFTKTLYATVAYPDENVYNTKRQHVGYAIKLNHYQGLRLMDALRDDIEEARKENLIYIFEHDNCCYWIHHHIENLIGKDECPNFFKVHLLKSEPKGFVKYVFNTFKLFPSQYIQTFLVTRVHRIFGDFGGIYVTAKDGQKTFKSLSLSSFWKDSIVYLPSLLHKQKERGWIGFNIPFDSLEDKKAA
jgi:hypothetical protein